MNLILFAWIVFFATSSFAQTRTLELEFESVVGATRYDFEVRVEGAADIFKKFSQKEPSIEVTLPFNNYEFRQRTLDRRKVPGAWSTWEKMSSPIPELKITAPKKLSQLMTNEDETKTIAIQWSGGDGIENFEVQILNAQTKKVIETKITKKREIEFNLAVATAYEVVVKTLIPKEIPENLAVQDSTSFSLVAKELNKPEIKSLKSPYAQEITWQKNDKADSYQVKLRKYSEEFKKWNTVYENKNQKMNQLDFDPSWRSGKYLLSVAAQGELRKKGAVQTEKFQLASLRTPAAEYNMLLIKAIDRVDGYFTQVSWLMTQMNLGTYLLDSSTKTQASPLGGTLRAGLGFFESGQPWGVIGFLNTSRMVLDNINRDFASFDLNGMYRHKFLDRDELRLAVGYSLKQLPILLGDSKLGSFNVSNSNVQGPRVGVEYWFSLGPYWGLQANYSQNFYNFIGNSSSPNGNRVNVPTSFQGGLQMSYQFSSRMTGLVGLSHQEEAYEYEALAGSGPQPVSPGSLNKGFLKADYIGLMVEIGL